MNVMTIITISSLCIAAYIAITYLIAKMLWKKLEEQNQHNDEKRRMMAEIRRLQSIIKINRFEQWLCDTDDDNADEKVENND